MHLVDRVVNIQSYFGIFILIKAYALYTSALYGWLNKNQRQILVWMRSRTILKSSRSHEIRCSDLGSLFRAHIW